MPDIILLVGSIFLSVLSIQGFTGGSAVKNRPAMQERQVQSLGQKDPLKKEMVTHSSIFAWEISWTEEPDKLQSMRSQESDTTEQLTLTPSSSQSSHKIATEMAEPLDPNNNTVTQLTANG